MARDLKATWSIEQAEKFAELYGFNVIVEPMEGPIGQVFSLNYMYGTSTIKKDTSKCPKIEMVSI